MAVLMQSNAVYIVQSEIVQLLTPLKRSFKSQDHEAQLPILNSLSQLRDVLAGVNSIHQVDLSTVLAPFLDCIRSEETSGPITALALGSVNKLLLYGYVDPSYYDIKLVSSAVSNISNAVNRARFVGVDSSSDEVILLKILQVLRTLLFVNASSLLTDEDICECLQTCFRICFEQRLSELLRKSAESILAEATFMLFSRIPFFKDDVRTDNKKLKLRTGHVDASQKAKKKSKKHTSPLLGKKGHKATSSPDLSNPDYVMVSQTDVSSEHALQNQLQHQQSEQDLQSPSDAVSLDSGLPQGKDQASDSASVTATSPVPTQKEPTPAPLDENAEMQYALSPYGISTVHELLRFLIQIINPIDKHNTPVMISLGLNLLTIAFETSADHVSNSRSLVMLVRDELLRNLLFFFSCDCKYPLFVSALRLGFFIYESCRTFLKFQLEIYLTKLFSLITSESGKVSFEYREAALEAVVDLWRVPGFVAELYINYDCSLLCSNIFEETTKQLSKNAFPVHGLFNTNLLSLEALLTVIDGIEEHCLSRMLNSVGDNSIFGPGSLASSNSSVTRSSLQWRLSRVKSTRMPSLDELLQNRHKKALLQHSIEEFNKNPKQGIAFMQEHKLMSPTATSVEIAQFLKNNPGVDKALIGEYIGNRKNKEILKGYIDQFSFDGLRIDEALRTFLESFRLPGEAPIIQMIMEQFAENYFNASGEAFGFANVDTAFTMAYAVIMLNTDQHNTNVRKQSKPMNLEDFKKNVKGCNNGVNFDEAMLSEIYFAIKYDEIVMPSEHDGVVKDKYLWKVALQFSMDPTKSEFLHVHPPGLLDKEVFLLSWRQIVSALGYVYERTISPQMIQKTLSGFRKCALISAHYNLHDVFDNLLITLCKFTNLAPPTGVASNPNQTANSSGLGSEIGGEMVAVQLGISQKAMLATKTVFNLAHRHGDVLRDGWRNILDTMCRLHAAQLLPPELEEVEDFVSDTGRISIAPQSFSSKGNAESGNSSGSVFSAFYNYLAGSGANDPHQNLSAEEREAINLARNCVTECHLELLLQDTKFLQLSSLHELMKALVRAIIDHEASSNHPNHYSGDDVFYLELLIRVVLQNRDRISNIWPMVRDCLFTCILRSTLAPPRQSSNPNSDHPHHQPQQTASFAVQRSVIGLLRLAVRLMRREEVSEKISLFILFHFCFII